MKTLKSKGPKIESWIPDFVEYACEGERIRKLEVRPSCR